MIRTRCPVALWLAVVAIAIAVAAGCTAPDRMDIFAVDWNRRAGDRDTVAIPDGFALHGGAEPEIDVPDEGPVPLSIEQAVLLGLRNDRELRVQQLDAMVTGTFEAIERGAWDMQAFVDAEYGEERSSESANSTGERFDVKGESSLIEAGLRQSLPTGTEIEGSVTQRRSISDRAPELQSARLGLTVTQALLDGLGPAVNLASVRQAELDTVASLYELRGFTEMLVAETEIAYWNHVLAHREIEIFERSLAVARQQRDEIEQRIEVGVLAETEAAAARAEVALREQALIDSTSNLEATRLRLLRRVDPGAAGRLDRAIELTTAAEIEPQAIEDLEERLTLAEKNRPDLNEARALLRRDQLETIVTRNGLLPRLDLFLALGRTGFEDTLDGSFQELQENNYDWTVGVSFSQMLGNRRARARDLAARAGRRKSAEALENLRLLVRLDVRLAVNDVERTRRLIAASAATRQLQEATVEAEQARFEVGSSTALLVAQAQRDLLLAQIREIEAVVQYRIARVRLFLAEGSLLERRGLRIVDPATGER